MNGAHAHNPLLVLLSMVVAITASHVALDSASTAAIARSGGRAELAFVERFI
jgi:NO-binding membrane sensor protein with MHYT domain